MAAKSRTIGNQLQRFRNGLESLRSRSKDFPFLTGDIKDFSQLIEDIVAADHAQEQAKLAQHQATQKLNGHMKEAEQRFAALKRYWQAKYGSTTPQGRAFDAPAQGNVTKPRAKKKNAPSQSE